MSTNQQPNVDTPVHELMAGIYAQAVEDFHRRPHSPDRLKGIIEQITYRPDYWVETGQNMDGIWFEVVHRRPDADTNVVGLGRGGKRYVDPSADVSDIVRMVFGAFVAYEEHEVREFFRFQDERIFSPHMDLTELASWMRGRR